MYIHPTFFRKCKYASCHFHSYQSIFEIEVIVVHSHTVKEPKPPSTVVVELFTHEDVIQRFADVLVDVRVVHIARVSILLPSQSATSTVSATQNTA